MSPVFGGLCAIRGRDLSVRSSKKRFFSLFVFPNVESLSSFDDFLQLVEIEEWIAAWPTAPRNDDKTYMGIAPDAVGRMIIFHYRNKFIQCQEGLLMDGPFFSCL